MVREGERSAAAIFPRDLSADPIDSERQQHETHGAEANGSAADEGADAPRTAGNVDDLKPFERGPEITEVR